MDEASLDYAVNSVTITLLQFITHSNISPMPTMRYYLLPLCCSLVLALILSAQEPASPDSETAKPLVQSEQEAAELGPKNKAYMEAFNEYREFAKKLTAMKIEYQDATPDRRKEIDAEYPKLFKQGLEIHKKSVDLALEAHEETPNRNPTVNDILYRTVVWEFNRENYEESVRIFKRMESSGIMPEARQVYVSAGLSAMFSMHYDEAEKWLKIARESGDMDKQLREWSRTKAGMSIVSAVSDRLKEMPGTKAAWAKELEIRKTEAEAGEQDPTKKLPRVEFTTTKGKIVLELFENEAPNTVANFISLVEKGFYNGTVFHRVLPYFMAQGWGGETGGPGYTIDDECGNRFPQQRIHFRGSISMANTGRPGTNGSQFFLTFVPPGHLNGGHTVFGRIVEGLDVLMDIQRYDPLDKEAIIPEFDKITEAKVLNKRDHAYEVKKNAGQ